MIIAEIGSTPYRIVLILHVLAVVVGFAPAWLTPVLLRSAANGDRSAGETLDYSILRLSMPGLGLAGLLGFALAGMSDGVFALSQAWLIASIVLWVILFAVTRVVIRPGIEAIREGDTAARSKVMAGTGTIHLILVVVLYLMVFKPGL